MTEMKRTLVWLIFGGVAGLGIFGLAGCAHNDQVPASVAQVQAQKSDAEAQFEKSILAAGGHLPKGMTATGGPAPTGGPRASVVTAITPIAPIPITQPATPGATP